MDQDVGPAGRARLFARRAKGALQTLRGSSPPPTIVASRHRDAEVDDVVAHDVLDLTMRIGEALLSSGSPVAGVTATMLRVAAGYGLTSCQVDITFTSITVSVMRDDGEPVTGMRIVKLRSADHSRLEALYRLADDAADGLSLDQALARLDEIVHAPHPYRRWLVTAALGGLAAGVAVLIGGGLVVALVAAVATAGVDRIMRLLNRLDLPSFFQHVAAAAFVTVVAYLASLLPYFVPLDHEVLRPSYVVSTGITVLLAGLGLVGAVQDAISGHYLTAAARNFEVLLQTLAIVIGVGMVLDAVARLSESLVPIQEVNRTAVPDLALVPVAGLVACMWALSAYSRWRATLVAAVGGAAGFAIFIAARELGLGPAMSSGLAALLVGAVADASASRLKVPQLVIATSGVVPLLPGLAIYQAMYTLVNDSPVDGVVVLFGAGMIGLALAAGVALGGVVARPLRQEVDRWDRRVRRRARSVRD